MWRLKFCKNTRFYILLFEHSPWFIIHYAVSTKNEFIKEGVICTGVAVCDDNQEIFKRDRANAGGHDGRDIGCGLICIRPGT